MTVLAVGPRADDRVRLQPKGQNVLLLPRRRRLCPTLHAPLHRKRFVEVPVRMLELFRRDHFAEASLNQWLGLTPAEVVAAKLNIARGTVAAMRKDKPL